LFVPHTYKIFGTSYPALDRAVIVSPRASWSDLEGIL